MSDVYNLQCTTQQLAPKGPVQRSNQMTANKHCTKNRTEDNEGHIIKLERILPLHPSSLPSLPLTPTLSLSPLTPTLTAVHPSSTQSVDPTVPLLQQLGQLAELKETRRNESK